MPDTANLRTTVKNPMAVSRFYGYLGRHGRTLAAGASLTFAGDLRDIVQGNARKLASLERDLLNGRIEIIRSPRPVMRDATTGALKALNLNNGVLGSVDPSWGAYTDV